MNKIEKLSPRTTGVILFVCFVIAVGLVYWNASSQRQDVIEQGVAELVAIANSPSSWPKKSIDGNARAVFRIGTHLGQYKETMQRLGFKFYENQGSPGQPAVIFTKTMVKPLAFGSVELRIIIDLGPGDEIKNVKGRVFLHTL